MALGVKPNHPLRGMCYVLSEALYHNGGKDAGLRPYRATYRGISHWWLQDDSNRIVDLTADQFEEGFPYWRGKRAGFLTKAPSKRMITLMKTLDQVRQREKNR